MTLQEYRARVERHGNVAAFNAREVEALLGEERHAAQRIAHEWALSVDNCVAAIRIGKTSGDLATLVAFVSDEIAAAIGARTA